MRTVKIPLFERLIAHAESEPASFHVPGHRYGNALRQHEAEEHRSDAESLARKWFAKVMQLDATELDATDDLHHPEASIKEAQELAAKWYGVEETYFLVGGSTAGNMALLLAVCEPDDIIIVQRNVHKSVINGLKLAGAKAVFLMPDQEESTAIATVPSLRSLEEALALYPDAKAVLLSNPNYYGLGKHLDEYAELVHRYRIPLLVDEAHGAHYGFHPELPPSALRVGADGVVQSAHKTLHALTMGGWLHVQGSFIDRGRLREALAMLQSSSPSFPIMASLDISRAIAEEKGEALFEPALQSCRSFRHRLENECFSLMTVSFAHRSESFQYADPLRILLKDKTGTMSGYRLQQELQQRGCWAEMADPHYVLLLFGLNTGQHDVKRLLDACKEIDATITAIAAGQADSGESSAGYTDAGQITDRLASPDRTKQISNESHTAGTEHVNAGQTSSSQRQPLMSGGDVSESRDENRNNGYCSVSCTDKEDSQSTETYISSPVPFHRRGSVPVESVPALYAVGRKAAEMVVPYPPGIPLVYAGEELTEATVSRLLLLAQQGAKFQGASDPRMNTIRVYKD